MTTLTVTTKGQVTLRKDILDHLGVEPGEQISVDKLPDGRLEVRAFGMLKKPGRKPVSIKEMNRVTARGWAGKITAGKK
jgi:AbrB family looped-hinge helix DNA binding protein